MLDQTKRADLTRQAAVELNNGPLWVRTLVRSQARRNWLAVEVAEAIYAESYEHVGADKADSAARMALADAVTRRVEERNTSAECVAAFEGDNEFGVGFVILPIILAAILSWMVMRLLDYLFPAQEQ